MPWSFIQTYGKLLEGFRDKTQCDLCYEKITLAAGWRVDSREQEQKRGSHLGGFH